MPQNTMSTRQINKQLDSLKTSVQDLYSSIYSTRKDNRNDLDRITAGIEDNLDDLLSSVNNQNVSSISTLITRLQKGNNIEINKLNRELDEMVTDRQIIDSISMENIMKYIQAEDYQYDLILKYVPKLEQALEVMKDNVLSSDNFSKDFINAVGNKSNSQQEELFSSRAKKLIDKYNFQELAEEMYIKTSKYGEYFLYQVPYRIAFERLITRKNAPLITREDGSVSSQRKGVVGKVLFESSAINTMSKKQKKVTIDESMFDPDFKKVLIENKAKTVLKMDMDGIIPEAIEEVQKAYDASKKFESLTEQYTSFYESYLAAKESAMEEASKNGKEFNEDEFRMTFEDAYGDQDFRRGTAALKTYKGGALAMSHDGMFSPISADKIGKTKIKDMSGCVMYEIPRENIIPLYIGDNHCIGYYYFRLKNDYISKQVVTANTFNTLTTSTRIVEDEFQKQNDALVSYIATQLSDAIDSQFINANIDLKDEIYAILRYSDHFNATNGLNEINVCFIPAEDIHHFYFDLDKKTHRGISDLRKSVVPAMLYCLLYLTDLINKVSRSQDKRIYYVKQNVETNVAKTMLNVVSQIKRGNMGMRQLENMNTIFNVIGKYNDHIVPRSQSGDSPIEFEVMPGQQSETPTDLMDRMEEAAVNSTDVPYEFVQSVNQVDFATRFTMSNSKFLRKVFKRQFKVQRHLTEIFRKLYNYEYNENETSIEIMLPAPAFLTMTNSQQLIDNIKNYATAIADMEIIDDDELKPYVIKLLYRNYLGSYIDFDKVSKLITQARHEFNLKATENESVGDSLGGGEDEDSGF